MTALRQEAMKLVENIPEGELVFFVDYLKDYKQKNVSKNNLFLETLKTSGLMRTTEINVDERDESYNSLLKMIKPIPNLDEEKELNEYRTERYKL